MERREFLAAGAAVIADWRLRIADSPPPAPNPRSAIRNPQPPQQPALSRHVFARPLARAQHQLQARNTALPIAPPRTNYEHHTGYHPAHSERPLAPLLPAGGDPAIV